MRARIERYARTTREPFVAAALVFPVYLLYQVGLAVTSGVRNGADIVTDLLLSLRQWQPEALWGLGAAVVVAYAVVLWRLRRQKRFSPSLFGLVALEGVVHGGVMFLVVNRVMRAILLGGGSGGDYPFHVDIILSLGAGFHEELVFRVFLFGGMIWLGRKLKGETIWVVLAAAVVSSLIFSAIHYIGPLADPLRVGSFVFRFLAGCYFAAVYRLRGFAVAVYTHAIYDIGIFAVT